MAIRTIEVPFRDDYNVGVGADLASGSPMGFVVDGTAEGVQSAGGATVNFTVRRIHTTEELHRSLGIDAEASFGSGLFGAGGFSARFSFSKDCAVQTSSLFLLLNCRVGLEHLSIKAPRLTPSAAQLIDKPQIFAERFGNMFVRDSTVAVYSSVYSDSTYIVKEISRTYPPTWRALTGSSAPARR